MTISRVRTSMLRLLLWRFLFDLLNLKRTLFPNPVTEHYFAYGGNLDPGLLKKRKIIPLSARPFRLEGYRLAFSHPSAFKGIGYASLEPEEGKCVYGKILTLTRTDCQRMDFYELVPLLNRYRRLYLSQNGENFFTYQSVSPKQGLLPSKAYLGMIIDGLKAGGFTPEEYIKEIASTNCLAEMTITSNLNFLVEYDASDKSIVSRILRTYDDGLLWIFINVFKGRSLTAWLIKT